MIYFTHNKVSIAAHGHLSRAYVGRHRLIHRR